MARSGGDIGDEGPGRGGPHQQVDIAILDREPHVHRGISDVAIDVRLAEFVA